MHLDSFIVSALLLLAVVQVSGAPLAVKPNEAISVDKAEVEAFKAEWDKLSKKEKKAKRKEMRKQMKSALKDFKKQKKEGSVDDKVLLAIIAVFIPFLAMGLYDGITKRFWISLLLTLLLYLPGLIYTLVIILRED